MDGSLHCAHSSGFLNPVTGLELDLQHSLLRYISSCESNFTKAL